MSTKQRIIIVTETSDAHTDVMMHHLRDLGHDPFRLHTADLSRDAHVTVRLGNTTAPEVVVDSRGQPIALHEARSIWWRRPRPLTVEHLETEDERAYAERELKHAWHGGLSELSCYFMSHPTAIERARYKLGQLQRARALGLAIPDTLVTSDVAALRTFAARHAGGIIYKPLGLGFLRQLPGRGTPPHDEVPAAPRTSPVVYTTRLTDDLLDDLDDLGRTPSLFQELVEKEVELRVTIIGDEVFVAEIKSQEHERTSTDWRHHDVDVPWSAGTLPDDVEAACMALTRGYGLNFGAIDLIRRPNGEHVFLEINANGQWMFVEQRVPELRMLDAMAACLIRGGNA